MEKNFPNERKPLRPRWKSNKIFSSLFSFKRITVHPERSDPNDSPENKNIQISDQNPTIFFRNPAKSENNILCFTPDIKKRPKCRLYI